MKSQSTPFKAFINGELTPNEFAVLITTQANASGNNLTASATEISSYLHGNLSRHAVARALRNLQDKGWLSWRTRGINRTSAIMVN